MIEWEVSKHLKLRTGISDYTFHNKQSCLADNRLNKFTILPKTCLGELRKTTTKLGKFNKNVSYDDSEQN